MPAAESHGQLFQMKFMSKAAVRFRRRQSVAGPYPLHAGQRPALLQVRFDFFRLGFAWKCPANPWPNEEPAASCGEVLRAGKHGAGIGGPVNFWKRNRNKKAHKAKLIRNITQR